MKKRNRSPEIHVMRVTAVVGVIYAIATVLYGIQYLG